MAKGELIDTGRDKRYLRRNKRGQFKEMDDVGRSLAADRRRRAKTKAKPGEGDKGDRPRRKTGRETAGKKSAGRKGEWAERVAHHVPKGIQAIYEEAETSVREARGAERLVVLYDIAERFETKITLIKQTHQKLAKKG